MSQPMVIFTRSFDFVSWLIPRTMDFPRSQRFVVTRRLQDAALDFYERIIEANNCRGEARLEKQRQADAALDKTRLYLRLAARWGWLTEGQYQHAAGMIDELGQLQQEHRFSAGCFPRLSDMPEMPGGGRRGAPRGRPCLPGRGEKDGAVRSWPEARAP